MHDVATDRNSGKYSLTYACAVALRWPVLATIFPRLCLIGFNYAQPFLISRAINFVGQDDGSKDDGYGLIGATGLIYLGIAVIYRFAYNLNFAPFFAMTYLYLNCQYMANSKSIDMHGPLSAPVVSNDYDVPWRCGLPHLRQDPQAPSWRIR